MKSKLSVITLLVLSCLIGLSAQNRYFTNNGTVYFKSDAPLEVIEAQSEELQGVIDPGSNSFAFSIPIPTFQGFNSPLQQDHFNENYMESKLYPKATFQGKIIEQEDLTRDGEYVVRAKGILDIHGVKQERIIRSKVVTKNGMMKIRAKFTVLLAEHDIRIPRIVHQKIAEEIQVEIEGDLKAREN